MSWFEARAQLDGTVAVITGGAGGLGEAITHDLAANGVLVAVVDRDGDAVERTIAALTDAGRAHIVRVGDARDPDVLASLFQEVDQQWGRLDTLVNVVGGTFRMPFTETTPKSWDVLLRTNLMHVLHACSLAIPRMKEGGRGGSIVNLTTIEGHRAAPGFAVYSAAKGAVLQFSRTLAVELAEFGIRVNNVSPDITPTPNMGRISGDRPAWDSEVGVKIAIPMGRVGVPQDISNAVVFLASGLSSYITGSTLHPDGGTYSSSGWFNWPDHGYGNTVPLSILDALGS